MTTTKDYLKKDHQRVNLKKKKKKKKKNQMRNYLLAHSDNDIRIPAPKITYDN